MTEFEHNLCMGSGPRHSTNFTVGDYANVEGFARGRRLTFCGVEVRACGCMTYPCLGPLVDLVQENPSATIFTWRADSKVWKVGGPSAQ